MYKATLFEKKKNDFVRCTCCQRYCLIQPGNTGFCGVRKNVDGDLYLSVFGKAIAVHTDPVEKKPLYHFLPGSDVFSLGTIGCNFRCQFCQNWDISQPIIGTLCEQGQELSPAEIIDYCVENEIFVIAYTYNEPTIFTEYAGETAKLAQKKGIKNVFVSNGYESKECLDYMKDWCDAINIDIKSFSEKFYWDVCGEAKLKGVLDSVKGAWERGIWVECTTLVIPGLNDSNAELRQIAEYIVGVSADIPWHVTAFHPDYKMMDRESTPASALERAWKIGREAGLKFVYSGNIPGMAGENTACPKCGEILIKRLGMSCLKNEVKDGACGKCGEKIPGIWK